MMQVGQYVFAGEYEGKNILLFVFKRRCTRGIPVSFLMILHKICKHDYSYLMLEFGLCT